ncbi:uncharacterized protein [Panulirus ornatus]|uniref:uncharacterized protein isoform X1 n=1 Tax=Panulirus ornatus TaxID=150431 RepID=UPI003A8A986E
MGHRLRTEVVVVVVGIVWLAGQTEGQSEPYCSFTPNHTLCKSTGVNARCGKEMQKRGVERRDATAIVTQHNQLRSQVATGNEKRGVGGSQPAASNMRLMEWDDELARVAQGHADQCLFKHDCPDCRRVSRFGVGQNLFISFQSNFDTSVQWERAIQAWYNEVADFNPKDIHPFKFSSGTGHYTQMLWWSTYKIGCGFIMFKEGRWWKKLYTCNYGPAGNIIFSTMYSKGSPCSSCPDGTSCSVRYPGLCQSVEASGVGPRRLTTTTTTTTTKPFPNNGGSNDQDNAILNPANGNSNNNGFNVFNGFIDINSINPSDVDLAALIRFFNSRRRSTTGTPLPVRVNPVFNRRVVRPSLITARPTTATGATQSRLPPTTATASPVPPSLTTLSTTVPTTIPTTARTTTINTTSSPTTSDTSSPEGSRFRSSVPTNQVLLRRTGFSTTSFPKSRGKAMETTIPAQSEQPDADATFVPFTGAQPTASDLTPFLKRAGTNTQLIRTSSLGNVRNIIASLPEGQKPIVLFRTGSGQLTELNPETLVPLQRSVRSTTTQGPGRSKHPVLLTCDLNVAPCEVIHIGGNWTLAESESEGQYMKATLEEGEGAQVVLKELVNAPTSQAVCVALSHRRTLAVGHAANATIPPLQVGVMPLGETMTRRPVLGAPGMWEMSRVTLQDIHTSFMLTITVGPTTAPATVDRRRPDGDRRSVLPLRRVLGPAAYPQASAQHSGSASC